MKKILVLGFSFMLCLMTSLSSCSSDPNMEEIETPVSDFYFQEPLLAWDADQSQVKDYMTGFTLVSSSTYSLIYEGKDCASSYLYAFSGKDIHLNYVTVAFDLRFKDQVKDFLDRNYLLQGKTDSNDIYSDDSHSTVITTSAESQFYLTYMSYDYMAK